MKSLTKIEQVKAVEIVLDRCEQKGLKNLTSDEKKKYADLKIWFDREAKKLRYI